MEKKNKKIKFSKKLIAASLLAVVVLVNCIYSSFQQVAAQGMFGNVKEKIDEIKGSSDKKLQVLEILPDSNSLSVLEMLIGVKSNRSGSYSFQDLLASYTSKDISAFANMLSQYGMINLDSTSSVVYPLTYYKPGDEDRIYGNTPNIPNPDVNKGYALLERQLAVGKYEVIDTSVLESDPDVAEIVYYQEVLPEEVSPSTPSEVTASTPTKDDDTPYFVNEANEKVYLKYKEEGFNEEIYAGTAATGRFFRFIPDVADGGTTPADDSTTSSYTGYGYRFVFGSKAEIRTNNLFTRFVLGVTDDANSENGSEVDNFNQKNINLQTISIDELGSLTGEGDIYDLSQYDLVYIANPFLYWDPVTKKIMQYDFANPAIENKSGMFSQWVMLDLLDGVRDADTMEIAATKLLEGAVNESTPLKLIVDSSILMDYETAVSNYESIIDALATDPALADSAAIAEASLDLINNSQIYKTLLMLAQDNFDSKIRQICTSTAVEHTDLHTYKLVTDPDEDESWANYSSEELREELYGVDSEGNSSVFVKTNGHYVNKNLYFYHHNASDYKDTQLTQHGLVLVQMVNGDFRSIMTKDILRKGFRDVVTAIEDENRRNAYLENGRPAINAEEITVDMVVQYLLNYEGKTIEIKKNNLRVLEIQPCADFDYAYANENDKKNNVQTAKQRQFIEKWVAYFAEENRYQDVSFTSMSIQEFIGKNEDLNATYDMIYIGSNIGKFPKHSNGDRKFNDTSMRGLIYTHIGDLAGDGTHRSDGHEVLSKRDVKGLLDTDYTDSSRTNFKDLNSKDFKTRTTGNDLTTYKKRDLLNFLESGYPIIVDEKLFTFGADGNPNAVNAKGEKIKPVTVSPSPTKDPDVTVVPTTKPTDKPTDKPTETPSKTVKQYIKFKNEKFNGHARENCTMYLYLWNGGTENAGYPGVACSYMTGKDKDGCSFYVVEFDNTNNYNKMIVSLREGSHEIGKTADTPINNTSNVRTVYVGEWGAKASEIDNVYGSNSNNVNGPRLAIADRATVANANIDSEVSGTELNIQTTEQVNASDNRTLYIRRSTKWTGWDTIYVHMWEGEDKTNWPGVKATKVKTEDGYDWYEVSMPKKYGWFLVNNNTADGKFPNTQIGIDDVYTVTLGDHLSIKELVSGTGTGTGSGEETVSGCATVDNSTYLYQLLKVATAQEGTVNVEDITLDTLNSDTEITNTVFDWTERTYKNLLVDRSSMSSSSASAEISQFLNETKIYINLTKRPIEYGYTTSGVDGHPIKITTADGKEVPDVKYLEPDADGRYYLDYEFSISTLAGSLNEKDFNCELFVDANFDGKFSDNSEFLDSLIIKNASTGQVIAKKDGEDCFRLQEGVAYTLTRKLPKSFDGCINWKLQITENGNDKILAAETGYCAIPVKAKAADGSEIGTGEKQTIKILQLTSGRDTSTKTTRTSYTGTHVNLQDELGTGFKNKNWHNLLNNIPDFKLDITTMSSAYFAMDCKDYDAANPTDLGGWPEHEGYDMIIVGFIDSFADIYEGGNTQKTQYMAEALIQFGKAGKSILFTHDTTAWTGDYQHKTNISGSGTTWNSSYLTVAVRDLCGNDQFGVVTRTADKSVGTGNPATYIDEFFNTPASTGKSYSNSSSEWNELLALGKDMAFEPNSGQTKVVGETQGSTYVNLRLSNYRWDGPTGNGRAYAQYVNELIPHATGDETDLFKSDDYGNEKIGIGKVNDGAITKYPYLLSDTMVVNSTHAQYWTVDIESDTNFDNESDLVVWYCLNDRKASGYVDYYSKSPNDVRNNYYIYNKGNITYTGAGHTPFDGEDEIKLFINTMIAAYNAQLRVPELNIVENGEPEADNLETLIIPYDSHITPQDLGKDFINIGGKTDESDIAGTMKVFFNVYDGNLTAKNKKLKIDEIFITDSTGTENANYKDINGDTVKGNTYTMSKDPVTGKTDADTIKGVLPIYDVETDELVEYDELISGKSYYINAPLNTIFANDYAIDLHITMHTIIGEGDNVQETGAVTDKLTITRAEIFDLD